MSLCLLYMYTADCHYLLDQRFDQLGPRPRQAALHGMHFRLRICGIHRRCFEERESSRGLYS